MAEVKDVGGRDNKGYRSAKIGRGVSIDFGKVPEPPAWRTGDQQFYHSQKYWWVIRDDDSRSVYIFKMKDGIEQGTELDFSQCVAKLNIEDLAL